MTAHLPGERRTSSGAPVGFLWFYAAIQNYSYQDSRQIATTQKPRRLIIGRIPKPVIGLLGYRERVDVSGQRPWSRIPFVYQRCIPSCRTLRCFCLAPNRVLQARVESGSRTHIVGVCCCTTMTGPWKPLLFHDLLSRSCVYYSVWSVVIKWSIISLQPWQVVLGNVH